MPPGEYGTVVEVRVFNRHGVEKDERALQIEREEVERLARDRDDELAILDRNIYARLRDMILGKTALKGPKGVKPKTKITDELLDDELSRGQWWQLAIEDEKDAQAIDALNAQYEAQKRQLDARFEDKVEKVRRGDDLLALARVGAHELVYHSGWVSGYRADIAWSEEYGLGLAILMNAEGSTISVFGAPNIFDSEGGISR